LRQSPDEIQNTAAAVQALLSPRSIAIVGASGDPSKLGALPLQFLQKYGYRGRLYPVNPSYSEIGGLRCYPSIGDVPEPVDLMVVTIPANRVPELLAQCQPGRVRAALVLTSGYAEVGPEGARMQEKLVAQARERGIRLCGPNSVGATNLWDAVVPAISQAFDKVLPPGPVAFVTQSGALGTAVMAVAGAAGIHLGYFISTGNEADLDFSDFCDYLLLDPRVRVIAGYAEGLRNGRKFAAVARRALVAGKPIVLLKAGRSPAGEAAARSHTGALTGSDALYQAVFEECGVVRVDSLEALIDALKVFCALEPPAGNRAALVTHSGGTGVIMSDACAECGLDVPPTRSELEATLRQQLPAFAALGNPIDMTANVIFQPDKMVSCLEAALLDPGFDLGVLSVNLMWRVRDQLCQALESLRQRVAKPFAVAWIGIEEATAARLQAAGVPAFPDPVRCIRALGQLARWGEASRRAGLREAPGPTGQTANHWASSGTWPVPPVVTSARVARGAGQRLASGACPGDYPGQAALLEAYGVPLAPWRLVRSAQAAVEAAAELGFPVVAKVISQAHTHKSDVGGVALDLNSPDQVRAVAARLLALVRDDPSAGVLIQPMVGDAVEVFVGAQRDPVFGPYVVVGLGGIYVEVFRETAVRLAPCTEDEALDLVRRARWYPLLQGVRGQPPRDVAALARVIARVSQLVAREPVASLDLNPVLVRRSGEGAVAVDFRIFWRGK
jgi:acyl-CoA synthetase (NDP forming)